MSARSVSVPLATSLNPSKDNLLRVLTHESSASGTGYVGTRSMGKVREASHCCITCADSQISQLLFQPVCLL